MEIQDIETSFEEYCSKGKQRNVIVAGGESGPERDLFKELARVIVGVDNQKATGKVCICVCSIVSDSL